MFVVGILYLTRVNVIFFAEINTLLEQMNDKSLLLKTEMLRLTEQIKLYEQKTFLMQNIFFK